MDIISFVNKNLFPRRHDADEHGITIVEVLFSITIVGFTLVAAIVVANAGISDITKARERSEALKIAEQQLELFYSLPQESYTEIIDSGSVASMCLSSEGSSDVEVVFFDQGSVPPMNYWEDALEDYPADCIDSELSRYHIHVQRVDEAVGAFQLTVRWLQLGGSSIDEVKLHYRRGVHRPSLSLSLDPVDNPIDTDRCEILATGDDPLLNYTRTGAGRVLLSDVLPSGVTNTYYDSTNTVVNLPAGEYRVEIVTGDLHGESSSNIFGHHGDQRFEQMYLEIFTSGGDANQARNAALSRSSRDDVTVPGFNEQLASFVYRSNLTIDVPGDWYDGPGGYQGPEEWFEQITHIGNTLNWPGGDAHVVMFHRGVRDGTTHYDYNNVIERGQSLIVDCISFSRINN